MNGIDNSLHRLLLPFFLLVLAISTLDARPVGFVENRGQWAGSGQYLARYGGLDLWVGRSGLVYDFHRADGAFRRGHVVRMTLGEGELAAGSLLEQRTYLQLRDGESRRFTVGGYSAITLRGSLPGVDLVVYDDAGHPRYDLHVAPGVDPATVRLRFEGADGIALGSDGALRLATGLGIVEQRGLVAYQEIDGERRTVACAFSLVDEQTVGFRLGAYDRRHPLVIDPVTFSTFIGGSGDDVANAIALDSAGNVYSVGETTSPDYPYVTGSYFATLRGTSDAFVTKLSADGSRLVYSTFIGGSDVDAAYDVAVDPQGFAYVVGMTRSSDFPARAAYDTTYNGAADAFVLKVDTSGRSLVWSTLLGGSAEDMAHAVALDATNRVYVGGRTLSSSFPTTPAAYQTTATGLEGFALRLAANGRTIGYSTFIGGDGDDAVVDVAVRNGGLFVAGNTSSDGITGDMFPVTTGAAQVTFGGISDGFAVALDTNGRSALYSTLLGGADVDEVRGIAVDAAGALYVTGSTASSTFPTTGGAFQTTLTGPSDAFVLKIGLNGSSLNYSTLLGGTGLESGIAVNVTGDGLALVTGNTSSANFPTVAGSLQQSLSGDQDLFVVELNALATAPMYSSYLGGTADDSVMDAEHIDGLTLYLAGSTMSTDFPTTTGAASTLHAGASDAFVSRFDIVQLLAPNGRNSLCAGDSHLISWTGSDLVNYDLAISANNGLTWTPLALGVNGTSYMWAPSASLPAGTAYRIRVRVAGGTEFDASDTAFTVLAPPRVLQHPTNFTRAEGASVTFTAAGTGSAPIGTVWQRSTDRGMTWTDIEGANADQYTTPAFAATDDSVQFRALYFNDCDTAATRAATVVVQAVRIVSPAGGEVFCLGTTQTISFTRQHVETVNIEISTNGGAGWNLLQAGVTGNSFDWTIPTGLRPGSDFRLRVVHAGGPASDAMDASFSIHSAPRVTIDPTDVTAPAGSAASFSVVGDAFPGYAIQWQSMAAGATEWTDIPNGNVAGLLLTGLTAEQNGTRVRAILSNACGADTSATATLTIGGVGSVETGVDASISTLLRPNPARDETNVTFVVRRAGDLRMTLVDARGEVVRTILERPVEPGSEDVRVDTRDLAAGRYWIVLALDEASVSLALTIVR